MNIYNSHEKNELNLLASYFDESPSILYYGEPGDITDKWPSFLSQLRQYDSPDMYAIVDDTLVIMEHFVFDASRETKSKGMERIRKDREAHAKLWENATKGNMPAVVVTQAGETMSLQSWQKNFERHFDSHYAKIGQYVENGKKAASMKQPSKTEGIVSCKIGFFIEEEFPPILEINGTLREARYIETKQFLDFFRDKTKVDFILYGTQYDGHRSVFYIDHKHTADRDKAFDLEDKNINISNINKNEHTFYFLEKL